MNQSNLLQSYFTIIDVCPCVRVCVEIHLVTFWHCGFFIYICIRNVIAQKDITELSWASWTPYTLPHYFLHRATITGGMTIWQERTLNIFLTLKGIWIVRRKRSPMERIIPKFIQMWTRFRKTTENRKM